MNPILKNKTQDAGLLFVLFISLLLCLAYTPSYGIVVNDIDFFQYCGTAILHGKVPYRDYFDHKPPLIFFINALGLLTGMGRWGLWLLNTAVVLVITFLLHRLGRQYKIRFAWLVPLLFNLMIKEAAITGDTINATREYSTFFVLFFFCALLGRSKHRLFLLGLFAALTFLTQQDQVLQLLPFFLYVLVAEETPSLIPKLTRMAAGFLVPMAVILGYFAMHGALSYFWEDAFLFNFNVYTREPKSLGDHFKSIKRILDYGNYELPFMVSLAMGMASLLLPNRKKGLVIAAIAAVFLSMSSEYLGGRYFGTTFLHDTSGYFQPLAGTVCILIFVVLAFTEDPILADWRAQLPYAILVCASLSYSALQHGTHLNIRVNQPEMRTPELPYLRQQNLKDYQFYVVMEGNYFLYYNELKVLSPTRWIYGFWRWYPDWDADHRNIETVTADLVRHQTTYVILTDTTLSSIKSPSIREYLYTFMKTHYQRIPIPGSPTSDLWKWKGIPAMNAPPNATPDSTR